MDNGIFCNACPRNRTPRLPNKYRINLVANRIRANLRSRNQNPPVARTEIDNALSWFYLSKRKHLQNAPRSCRKINRPANDRPSEKIDDKQKDDNTEKFADKRQDHHSI